MYNHEVGLTRKNLFHVKRERNTAESPASMASDQSKPYQRKHGEIIGLILSEFDTEEFEAEVDDLLGFWAEVYDLPDRDRTNLRDFAVG